MCGLEMDHRGTKCGDVVHIEDNPIIWDRERMNHYSQTILRKI
jgi:hypothetical protein